VILGSSLAAVPSLKVAGATQLLRLKEEKNCDKLKNSSPVDFFCQFWECHAKGVVLSTVFFVPSYLVGVGGSF